MHLGRRSKHVYALHTLEGGMHYYLCAKAEGEAAKKVDVCD